MKIPRDQNLTFRSLNNCPSWLAKSRTRTGRKGGGGRGGSKGECGLGAAVKGLFSCGTGGGTHFVIMLL
jgi:hypothetical protein